MLERFTAEFTAGFPGLVGSRIVVALSGGSDSVALLRLLVASFDRLGCTPLAAHIHHHVRGSEADRDAAFCADLCRDLGVAFAQADIDRPVPRGHSREAFWRAERYRLLDEIREARGCAAVATAHTLDDQAETVLLKLLRGTGPRGVAGIRRRHGTVVRPLLSFQRIELREWLEAGSAVWCEDSTNASTDSPRGFVRHVLLPLVLRHEPAAARHLTAFAATLAEDERFIASLVADALPQLTPRCPAPLAVLAHAPRPLLRRWLLALASRLELAEPPSRDQMAAVETMLARGRPGAVDLGRHWVLRRRGSRVLLSPPPLRPFAPLTVAVPSTVTLAGGFVARLGWTEHGDADHVTRLSRRIVDLDLQWRPARPGEAGPDGRGRLFERLSQAGIPAEWRCAWPVLAAGGRMIWVPGLDTVSGWDGDGATGVIAEVEEPWRRHTRS